MSELIEEAAWPDQEIQSTTYTYRPPTTPRPITYQELLEEGVLVEAESPILYAPPVFQATQAAEPIVTPSPQAAEQIATQSYLVKPPEEIPDNKWKWIAITAIAVIILKK